MARPAYQTPRDSQNESAVAARLSDAWGMTLLRMPPYAFADWLAWRGGELCAAIEIKCRTIDVDDDPYYMLSMAKYQMLRTVADAMKTRCILVVRFRDGVVMCGDLQRVRVIETGIGGRRDRGDPADIEPCVFLALADMRQL